MSKIKAETYGSVWDAIADTPEEAANLRARAELMKKNRCYREGKRLDPRRSGSPLRRDPTTRERPSARAGIALLA
jgi:hypothetical protein